MISSTQAPLTPDPVRDARRSAMLRLTTRIAGAQNQKDVFTGLAFGMMDQCFGFTGVEVRLAADDRSSVQAGDLSANAARLETPFTADGGISGTITVERAQTEPFDEVDREVLAAAALHVAPGQARATGCAGRAHHHHARAIHESLQPLDGEHPGLGDLAPDLVGPSRAGVVLPELQRAYGPGRGAHALPQVRQ